MSEPLIKRIPVSLRQDERGFVCFPLDDDLLAQGKYYNVHIPSMNPGTVRGNHFHPEIEEYIFIMGKEYRIVAEDQATKKREEIYVQEQLDSVLLFPANVAHAIRNEGKDVIYLVCYNRREGGEEGRPATERAEILE